MNNQPIIISKAPGKILLAGGYGVLQQNNYGLTLSIDSYFYCICKQYNRQINKTQIKISSKQIQQTWYYTYDYINDKLIQVNNKQNNFVENAIGWTLKILKLLNKINNKQKQYKQKQKQKQYGNIGYIQLEIVFNRNFISDKYAINPNTQFTNYKQGYSKTGLGSSACVVVSIVKCLLSILYKQLQQNSQQQFNKLTNIISQFANLNAQKKIGSNFDISTAVYGTHLYKNILPYKIQNKLYTLINIQDIQNLLKINTQISLIKKPSIKLYSYIIDINKGTDTRIMVKSFMIQLKKTNKQIQQQFFNHNKQIVLQLYQLFNKQQFNKIKLANKKHRLLQQKYTNITNVPIQPNDLTMLIDQIYQLDQVIYVICPGSGGYDAVFVMAVENVQERLEKICIGSTVRSVNIQFGYQQKIKQQQKKKILEFLKLKD